MLPSLPKQKGGGERGSWRMNGQKFELEKTPLESLLLEMLNKTPVIHLNKSYFKVLQQCIYNIKY